LALPEFFAGTLADYAARHEGGGFLGILIDAPCSGLGVIGRHPEIRWLRQKADLVGYQRQQLALLTAAAPLLAAGGVIVYATCSTEPEENEVVVRRFLASHPDFFVVNAGDVLPASASALVDDEGFLRILPGDHGLDGFFGARLVRAR
jgi:16S rRNA (cytosine967-C5)-methyltransferase